MPTLNQSTSNPPINFACPSSGATAASLMADLEAAVASVRHWAPIEDHLNLKFSKSALKPKVLGGRTGAFRVIAEGKPDEEYASGDWFYTSREEIEKDFRIKAAKAANDDEREAIKAKFDALLAEFDQQVRARAKSMPTALRKAKREVRKAHDAWTAAEQAISDYRPQSSQEAQELLAFCSRDNEIFPDEYDLKRVMQNAAEALIEFARG